MTDDLPVRRWVLNSHLFRQVCGCQVTMEGVRRSALEGQALSCTFYGYTIGPAAESGQVHAVRRGKFLRQPEFHVDAGPAGSHRRFLSGPAERAIDVR